MIKWFFRERETFLNVHLLIGFSLYAKHIKSLSYSKHKCNRYKFQRKEDMIEVLTLVFLEITSSNYFLQIDIYNLVCKAKGMAGPLIWLGAKKEIAWGPGSALNFRVFKEVCENLSVYLSNRKLNYSKSHTVRKVQNNED